MHSHQRTPSAEFTASKAFSASEAHGLLNMASISKSARGTISKMSDRDAFFLAGAGAVLYKIVDWDLGVVLEAVCAPSVRVMRENERNIPEKDTPSEPLDAVKHSQPITDTPVPL
ncbi:MAG: hypothetical protein ASARMPRED_001461 [Alectoria sarmentosa]|nr:MAG: hypothetical protein ASARMPRED_001461 [Alectoria sarmentosa]